MKKGILLVLLSAGVALAANAQVSFGVHANGIGAGGKMESEVEGETIKFDLKNRFSWKAGAVAFVPIAPNFTIMAQLNLLSKGGKISESYSESYEGTDYSIETKMEARLTYIEVPLNITYSSENFWVGAGPSLSYGIGGKSTSSFVTKADGKVVESSEEEGKVKFDGKADNSDDLHLKALEMGANFTAGYKFNNGLFVQANFNLGLSNISPAENSTWKNRYFGIGVGYVFRK